MSWLYRHEEPCWEIRALTKSDPIKLTQATLVNENIITVCFSDGTVGLYTAATLLACPVMRVPSDECFPEYHLANLHNSMPEGKLPLAGTDGMRSLFRQS